MRREYLCALLSFLLCIVTPMASAQGNLVPNNGFELHTTCPGGFSQFNGYVSNWVSPNTASPDYMNSCANPLPAGVPQNGIGYQAPHSGNAYAGTYTFSGTIYREFIQVQLTSPLTAGQEYLFSMYAVLHNKSHTAVDDLGAYFSVTAPNASTAGMLSGSPQPQLSNPYGNVITDTLNWTLISGTYTATGGEQYLTLGHLKSDANTTYLSLPYGTVGAYYYFDDISLTEINILPITLTSFNGELLQDASGKGIQLNWATASEINTCCFSVERSEDGKNFSDIGRVDGALNSITQKLYSFNDKNPLHGINYYRLREEDVNGMYSFSSVIAIDNSSAQADVNIFFNNDLLLINNGTGNTLSATLYSMEGREYDSFSIYPGVSQLNPSGNFKGVYILRLRNSATNEIAFSSKVYFY